MKMESDKGARIRAQEKEDTLPGWISGKNFGAEEICSELSREEKD